MKYTAWTTTKIRRLRELYPVASWPILLHEFAPHTEMAIRRFASQMGLKRPQRTRDWSSIAKDYTPKILRKSPA